MIITIVAVIASIAISYFLGWISGIALGTGSVLLAVKEHCGEQTATVVANQLACRNKHYAHRVKNALDYYDLHHTDRRN